MNPTQTIATFFLSCWVALSLQVYFFSPISPHGDPLYLPPWSPSPNNHLQEVIRLGKGNIKDPEDVSIGEDGVLYTATRDGWIKRVHRDGSVENWKLINNETMLGSTITREGHLVICDTEEGLLKVQEDGVTIIASNFNGSKIKFADEVVEGDDGSLYFSIPSTKFTLHNWYLDVLEANPNGQLLKYDPNTNQTTLVLDNLCFPNGVAISNSQDFLVVCETWKYRCLKYWLKGSMKGKTEIFIDNLPGGPDNIHLAPDGSFWIALLQLTRRGTEFIHKSKVAKHIVATYPRLLNFISQGTTHKATVVNVDATNGNILRRFDDPDGAVMSFVTSAVEFEGYLYLGGLNIDFIGKLPLTPSVN